MALRSMMTGVAALALAVTPALGAAQTTAPTQLAPASEDVRGSELRGNFREDLTTLIVIIGSIAILYLLLEELVFEDDESKVSP